MPNNLTSFSGFNDITLSKLPAVVKRGIKHEGGLVVKQTVVADLYEQGRAHITQTVLENVGTLTALEEHLTNITPSGYERYKAIVDAYTLGAANKIARW